MITDEQIRKISFAIAVIGVAGIVLIGQYAVPEKITANMLTDEKIGKLVEISGTVFSVFSKDGNVFLGVADASGNVSVVMFERTARTQKSVYDLKKGDDVTVTGKVLLYRSELEVQADKIEKI